MEMLSKILVGFVALEHIYILILEMFLWTKSKGLKAFGMTKQQAEETKVLAANQGLYNGFLAVGLIWALIHPATQFSAQLQIFFLLCIMSAAVYSSLTVKKLILRVQGSPALLAFISILFWQ